MNQQCVIGGQRWKQRRSVMNSNPFIVSWILSR